MRKYALLKENVVIKVESLEESELCPFLKDFQLAIDVEDLLVTPAVGWVLSGNILIPGPGQSVSVKEMIKAKIKL